MQIGPDHMITHCDKKFVDELHHHHISKTFSKGILVFLRLFRRKFSKALTSLSVQHNPSTEVIPILENLGPLRRWTCSSNRYEDLRPSLRSRKINPLVEVLDQITLQLVVI